MMQSLLATTSLQKDRLDAKFKQTKGLVRKELRKVEIESKYSLKSF